MVARYSVAGEVFRSEKPTIVSETRFGIRPRPPSRDIAMHPDGRRFAIAPALADDSAGRLGKLVLVFNFLDELRRVAPPSK